MNKNKIFFFYELHIFNLPLFYLLSFFGDVKVFKFKGWCKRYLHTSNIQSISDFKDVDQWRETKELALRNLKFFFQSQSPEKIETSINQLSVNFTNIYMQNFVRDYEQYLFFVILTKNYEGKIYIFNYYFSKFLHKNFPELEFIDVNLLSFAFIDKLSLLTDSIVLFLKSIIKLFFLENKVTLNRSYKYLWAGISPVEYPKAEGKLDFSWPILNGIIKAEDTLFILEVAPSEISQKYLASNSINYVTRNQLISNLPIINKFSIIVNQFLFLLKYVFNINYKTTFMFSSILQSKTWIYILKKLNSDFYVYSFSSGWPELPEVAACRSLNIKSICWFYGTSEFGYTTKYSEFTDENVRFSIRESDETWVWNNLIKKLIEKRNLIKTSNQIHVIGSILNGNLNVISNPSRVKNEFFKIAIFDITPMKPHMRLQYGEGPYCSQTMQERFYQDMLKIYNQFSNVQLIIKTKRSENLLIYQEVETLKYFQTHKLDRVIMLDSDTDPYEAIGRADLVISTPYTSPSLLALSFGVPGIFYDPTRIANYTYLNAFKNLTIYNEEELIKVITKMINGDFEEFKFKHDQTLFPVILPEEIKNRLRQRLS